LRSSRRPAVLLAIVLVVWAGGGCGIPGGSVATTGYPVTTVRSTTTVPLPDQFSTTSTSSSTLPPGDLVLGFAGDTAFTDGLAEGEPLAAVSELTGAPDFMAVNLESVVAEDGVGEKAEKEFTFLSPPTSVGPLRLAGIDLVGTANNHILDFGAEGMSRTRELLEGGGLEVVGTGGDDQAAYQPVVLEAIGRRVGFLSFSRILETPEWAAAPGRPGVAAADDEALPRTIDAITAALLQSDLVVVLVHWGIELDSSAAPRQREIARQWIEAGASLVVGSHPHVLQGLELIDGGAVLYSAGNFVFASARGPTADTAVFTFRFDAAGLAEVTATPLLLVDGKPQPAGAEDSSRILAELGARSFGWDFATGIAEPTPASGLCGD
jgi:poly-gamma-glutamate synthesis protein (capsule biosynthesis protein)